MKNLIPAIVLLVVTLFPASRMGFAQAPPDADSGTSEATQQPQPLERPKPAKSVFQKLGQAIGDVFGKSAEKATFPISTDLVSYLNRQVSEQQQEIARLKGDTNPAAVPKVAGRKPAASGRSDISQKAFRNLLARLDRVEAELARLKGKNGQRAADKKVRTLLDTPYVGTVNAGTNSAVRYFAARLILVNPASKPITIKRDELRLNVEGKAHKIGSIPARIQSQSFSVGNQHFSLSTLKTPAELKIPARGSGSMWVVSADLPNGGNVPKLSLHMQLAGQATTLDVNKFFRGVLGLRVERVGYRGLLGLLTISGSMNTLNVGSLVEELDTLTAAKVVRVVVRWEKSAPPLEYQLNYWLAQAAHQAGRSERNQDNRFPIISAGIRELHLAQMPDGNQSVNYSSPYGSGGPKRIHKTDYEAVTAALRGAYRVLAHEALLQEIETGGRLIRVAALTGGGDRLPADRLPMILEYVDDKDPQMQRAAVIALRHFGEAEAVATLIDLVHKGKQPLASAATESLAGSRFATAHQALLELLQNEPAESKKQIVALIARYPRPIWSETIYEFATADGSPIGVAALRALVSLGHPKLLDVLEDSLKQGKTEMRTEAFNLLASRTDPRSEELAIAYTLKHLEKSPPTSKMLELLNRTRDRRAIAPLLAHFEKSKSNRSALINTLAQIGDQSVADTFLKQYGSLKTHEKSVVLNLLRQLRSPGFRDLAGQALYSKDSSLIRAACEGLRADGSKAAVKLLADAFANSKTQRGWSYISNALYSLGSPEARAALKKGTKSKNAGKRSYAINALANLRRRSPGYQYIYQAQNFDRQRKWKEAIVQYSAAAQVDPQLPEAFSGRGNALLKQNKFKEAGKDFETALKLDEFNLIAVTGLGIVRVVEGKTEEGVKLVEDNRKNFQNNVLFAYNAACVYGRALEGARKDKKLEDRDKKLSLYKQKALVDLKQAVKLGFSDLNWMKKDPDLNSLHEEPEFKKIISPGTAGAARPPKAATVPRQLPIAIP